MKDDLCPTCGGGVYPGRQSTDCPDVFHGPRQKFQDKYKTYEEIERLLSQVGVNVSTDSSLKRALQELMDMVPDQISREAYDRLHFS